MLSAILLLVALAWPVCAAAAEDDSSLAIGPSKITMSLMQGANYQETLRIENDSDVAMQVTVAPWNFAYDEDGEIQPIADRDADRFRGAALWVDPVEPFRILPHTEATVPVSVTVPLDARVGTYSAYVMVTGVPEIEQNGGASQARVRYQLNGLLLVIVQSPSDSEILQAAAKLVSFEGPKNVMFDDPVSFTAKIDNTGNVHLDLEGEIIISGTDGVRVNSIPVSDHTLLPEQTTTLMRDWQGLPLFGRFSAQLIGECCIADNRQAFQSEIVDFWYVSRVALYAVSIAFLLLVVAVVMFRRRFRFRIESVRSGAGE